MSNFLLKCVAAAIVLAGGAIESPSQTKTFSITFPARERVWNPTYQGKPERLFEELEHKLSDAMRLADKVVLEKVFSEQMMILGMPHTKPQWIELLVSGKGTFVSIEKRVTRIQMIGDTTVTTGIQYIDSKTASGGSTYQFNFMNTWKKSKDGSWECVGLASDQAK